MTGDPIHRDVLRLTSPGPSRTELRSEANSSVQVNPDTYSSSNGAPGTAGPSGLSSRHESPEPSSLLRRQMAPSALQSAASSQQDRTPTELLLSGLIQASGSDGTHLTSARGVKRPHEAEDEDGEAEDDGPRKRDKLGEEIAEMEVALWVERAAGIQEQASRHARAMLEHDPVVKVGAGRETLQIRTLKRPAPSKNGPEQVADDS